MYYFVRRVMLVSLDWQMVLWHVFLRILHKLNPVRLA
ncbi:Uncharacterised protein [Chromobacterium vaccinii]|nr:Uncharacterised protein [Chromobacterium vaccinii]